MLAGACRAYNSVAAAQAQHVASEPLHAGLLFFRHGVNTTRFIDVWQQRLDSDSKVCGPGMRCD